MVRKDQEAEKAEALYMPFCRGVETPKRPHTHSEARITKGRWRSARDGNPRIGGASTGSQSPYFLRPVVTFFVRFRLATVA